MPNGAVVIILRVIPSLAPFLPGFGPVAIAIMGAIAAGYAVWGVKEAIEGLQNMQATSVSEVTSQEYLLRNNLSEAEALDLQNKIMMAFLSRFGEEAYRFNATTYTSIDTLNADYQALSALAAVGGLSQDFYIACKAHYVSEVERLTVAPPPAPPITDYEAAGRQFVAFTFESVDQLAFAYRVLEIAHDKGLVSSTLWTQIVSHYNTEYARLTAAPPAPPPPTDYEAVGRQFVALTFESVAQLATAYRVLQIANEQGLISGALWSSVVAHYNSEYTRLTAAPAPAPTPTEWEQRAETFITTTYASSDLLSREYGALESAHAQALISDTSWSRVRTHYDEEFARLRAIAPGAPPVTVEVKPNVIVDTVPIADATTKGLEGVGEHVESGLAGVGGAIGTMGSLLTSAIPLVGVSMVSSLLSSAEGIGHGLSAGRTKCFPSTASALIQQLLQSAAPLGVMAALEFGPLRDKFTDPLTHWLFDELFAIPEQGRPIEPKDAPQLTRRILERAIGLGIAAHLASVAAEASAPLKTMGLGYLAAFMADMAGFGRIAAVTMGTLESQALGLPMRYYVNEKVRSSLPSTGDMLRMAGEYAMVPRDEFERLTQTDEGLDQLAARNRDELAKYLPYQGYTDKWVSSYQELADRPARYFSLRAMADAGIWDPVYFRQELLNNGHNIQTVRHMMDMLYAMSQGELKTLFTSTAIKRYKEGLDTQAQFENNLTTLGVRPMLLPKYVYAANLEADYDEYYDYLTALKEAVQKGQITPERMADALEERGLRAERAELLAEIQALKLIKKPTGLGGTTITGELV